MAMRVITNFVVFAFLIALSSCKEHDIPLPPISSTGADTFGCLVNGKVFSVRGVYGETRRDVTPDMVVIYASRGRVAFQLKVRDVDNPIVADKKYFLSADQNDISCSYANLNDSNCDYFDIPTSGYIMFTKVHPVYSGVFEFTVYSNYCKMLVSVTEGRFDL